jgi:hypothetical protein
MVPIIIGYSDLENPASVFMYKDKDEKINMGPLWDYDLAFGAGWGNVPAYTLTPSINESSKCRPTQKPIPSNSFFNRFFQDPLFLAKYKEFWNSKYPEISSILSFIDETANKINKGAKENFKIWWLAYPVDFDEQIGLMKDYYDTRINYLNGEYNKVDVLPKTKTFDSQSLDYPEIAPQTFTFVAYGDMTKLSATLKSDILSNFVISTQLSQTKATGGGGYLATISVKPKNSLSVATYKDTLILKGENQGIPFTVEAQLTFIVKAEQTAPNVPTILSKTANSITLNKINGAEYSIDNGEKWQDSEVFKDLNPESSYTLYARMKSTATHNASDKSAPLVTTTNSVAIIDIKKSDKKHGILLEKGNIVSNKAEMRASLPNNERVVEMKITIYDNIANAVFEKSVKGDKTSWDLTNNAGRSVANGSYLIIAEVRGASQKVYIYSVKVGVKK